MATKQEHLCELVSKYMKTLGGLSTTVYSMLESNAEALAERDAAREEAADWKSKFEHADATAEQVLGLWNGTLGMREELATLKAAQPAEDVAPKLREALALSLGVDPSRPIWALVNEAITRIRFLEVAAQPVEGKFTVSAPFGWCMTDIDCSTPINQWIEHTCRDRSDIEITFPNGRSVRLVRDVDAAQPESAPVVGGVTELMLDEIQHLVDQYPYCPGVDEKASAWLTSARAAIRAQKRVDVEAIRSLAHALPADYRYGKKVLLQAIGDEPAEAPVAEPDADAPKPAILTLDSREFPDLPIWRREPAAEPAAPAQEGPFTVPQGYPVMLLENGSLIDWTRSDAERIARLANAGLKAEKLRARVAELEAKVTKREAQFLEAITARPEATQALRNLGDALGLAADSPAWGWQIDNMAADRLRSEKARADAAEANLAALGENPIPRALGERWHSYASGLQSGAWFAELLAGREPGVAS